MKRESDRKCVSHARIPELRVLVLTKRHVGSRNEIGPEVAILGADQKERGPWGREWLPGKHLSSDLREWRYAAEKLNCSCRKKGKFCFSDVIEWHCAVNEQDLKIRRG